jgi:hypothetical protein
VKTAIEHGLLSINHGNSRDNDSPFDCSKIREAVVVARRTPIPGYRKLHVSFKDGNGVLGSDCSVVRTGGYILEFCAPRAVKTLYYSTDARTERVLRIVIDSVCSFRLAATILSCCFLH